MSISCSMGKIVKEANIGTGGQGSVYKVSVNGKSYALKIYPETYCTPKWREHIEKIVGYNIKDNKFILPLDIVDAGDRFGYIMDLIPDHCYSITEYIGKNVQFDGNPLAVILKMAANICAAYAYLHYNHFIYKDISSNNINFDSKSGDIFIFDNDNISSEYDNQSNSSIFSSGYAAPEFIDRDIIKGDRLQNTRQTELHSLATLLFRIFCTEDPFQDKQHFNLSREELESQNYGMNGNFVFSNLDNLDENIDVNIDGMLAMKMDFEVLTQELREMFNKAFTIGMKTSDIRVEAMDWMFAIVRMLAGLYPCPHCGQTHIYKKEQFIKNGNMVLCDDASCHKNVNLPRMRIRSVGDGAVLPNKSNPGYIVMLYDGALIYNAYFMMNGQDINDNHNDIMTKQFEIEEIGGKYYIVNVGYLTLIDNKTQREIKKGDRSDVLTNGALYTVVNPLYGNDGVRNRYIKIAMQGEK